MRRNLKWSLFIVLPLLLSFAAHKFYVSVTNISYAEETDALQVKTRVFIDDLEDLLKERYEIEAQLDTKDEAKLADFYIEKYLRSKFVIRIDGQPVAFNFIGKKYDVDVVICYLEFEQSGFKNAKSLSIQNEILTDLYEEQKNIVHLKWGDNKRSFVLTKNDAKGMLNL
ncbi:hypothetical protein GCM10011414_23110 [Croceivirga lutea]|uniref:DUF6702 family protein n=1 Tax=Croceivirga lutea TaxID=1775167 RepID=UPI001639E351|nr:DUF6702 family protein [Croceivirga lutea]GGG52848.1 hypothetical protein GCM10011414_23110 [Croceivirga lutea]